MGDKRASSPVIVAAASVDTPASPAGTPKKGSTVKPTNLRSKPAHPKTAEMVNSAIASLKERGGMSLQAIKKYIIVTYKIDMDKQSTFIKKYLKSAVASGTLIQTKGKGAAGSFKLATSKVDTAKARAKLAGAAKAPKKAQAVKNPAVIKKSVAAKKTAAAPVKKASTKKPAAKAVSTNRARGQVSRGPAAKPPKPKTTKAKPAAKSPAKKAKPVAAKKIKPLVTAAKPKKVAAKKAVTAKK